MSILDLIFGTKIEIAGLSAERLELLHYCLTLLNIKLIYNGSGKYSFKIRERTLSKLNGLLDYYLDRKDNKDLEFLKALFTEGKAEIHKDKISLSEIERLDKI